ncbi:MAG: hypothetical protein A2289_15610 [Deltaproteobacteria bacterium RIFOXYA12_FULL_58_15]|nr:MAG: hypothetical protein A2289_15610 [Deltaproteobacteria bacterium RIFOXYA12_FULL_58_15]OGR09791.1 MAG: hypothetical protein A2341_28695 [Deltaproteobacteria bacterium RIFOXYB12_FULL_58_9]
MILDKLENAAFYSRMSENLKMGFDFLKGTDLAALGAGRHDVLGNDVFALVSEYELKKPEDCRLEAHRIYTDIQYLVNGEELIGYSTLRNQVELASYNPEKDITFYAGNGTPIRVEAGMFAVFFPQDLHCPCMQIVGPEKVKKIVVKVKI